MFDQVLHYVSKILRLKNHAEVDYWLKFDAELTLAASVTSISLYAYLVLRNRQVFPSFTSCTRATYLYVAI